MGRLFWRNQPLISLVPMGRISQAFSVLRSNQAQDVAFDVPRPCQGAQAAEVAEPGARSRQLDEPGFHLAIGPDVLDDEGDAHLGRRLEDDGAGPDTREGPKD